jgi:6-pyruvoyltetrahydropterin/6-carboxytetrahydropterin synthase
LENELRLAYQRPTIENLVAGIWQQLEPNIPGDVKLHCLKLYETARIYVEYYGE